MTSPFKILSTLHQASRQVGMWVDEVLNDLGVTGQEGQLLAFVAAREGVAVTELVYLLGVPKSTMTSMLQRLERRQLIQRRANAADQRSFLIFVTRSGAAVARAARERVLDVDSRLAAHISGSDIAALARIRDVISAQSGIDLMTKASQPHSDSNETRRR